MLDLWPNDITEETSDITTPVSILKAQATLLGKKTNSRLEATVEVYVPDVDDITFEAVFGEVLQPFTYIFYFFAPSLENYHYKLFTISYDIDLYPVHIFLDNELKSQVEPGQTRYNDITAHSEEDFIKLLKKIFNAQKTKRIIQSILAQTTAIAE